MFDNKYNDLGITSTNMTVSERQLTTLEVLQKLDEAEIQSNDGIPDIDGRKVFTRLKAKYART